MKKDELIEILQNGENSGIAFKLDDIRPAQLAKEIVALANFQRRSYVDVKETASGKKPEFVLTEDYLKTVINSKICD